MSSAAKQPPEHPVQDNYEPFIAIPIMAFIVCALLSESSMLFGLGLVLLALVGPTIVTIGLLRLIRTKSLLAKGLRSWIAIAFIWVLLQGAWALATLGIVGMGS